MLSEILAVFNAERLLADSVWTHFLTSGRGEDLKAERARCDKNLTPTVVCVYSCTPRSTCNLVDRLT